MFLFLIGHKIFNVFSLKIQFNKIWLCCSVLVSSKRKTVTNTFSCSFAWPESASVSVTVLVDVGLIAVDLDTVLGVLAVVPVAVGAVDGLVAGT